MPHSTKSKTKSYRGFSGWLDSFSSRKGSIRKNSNQAYE